MTPHTLFQIEDFQKDDLTISVQIEGRESLNIPVKDYEKWLKESDKLLFIDKETGKLLGSLNVAAYWERSEFFIVQDLYDYIYLHHDLVHEIFQEDL